MIETKDKEWSQVWASISLCEISWDMVSYGLTHTGMSQSKIVILLFNLKKIHVI